MTTMTTTTTPTAPRWRARRRVVSRAPRSQLPRATADADETTTTDDDDDARRLTAALRHARASASAAYSPGAGLGLTPEEQSEAAYADLLDTSLGVVERDDEDEDEDDDGLSAAEARAYASGGSMDRASMAMKNDGNAFKTAYELFKALSRGAHIVNDDTGGRGRRDE
jgi:hypothetical protein